MNRLTAFLGFVAVVLLAALFYEVHGLNRRLDAVGAAVAGAIATPAAVPATSELTDSDYKRLDEERRRIDRYAAEMSYVLTGRRASKPKSATTPK